MSSLWATFFDSWSNRWPDQGENFQSICSFVREDPEHRKLLIGNHDWAYLSQSRNGSKCSGHQSNPFNKELDKSFVIRSLLLSAKDILQLAWECDGWVFSHAGFSKVAVAYMKDVCHSILDVRPKVDKKTCFDSKEECDKYMEELSKDFKEWDESEYSIDLINRLFRQRLEDYNASDLDYAKKWLAFDEKLDWDGCFSGSGNEPSQFCLWIRPEALITGMAYPKQVVGHTEYCMGDFLALKSREDYLLIADSRNHKVYDIFDTENPPEAYTLLETQKKFKRLNRRLGDIKSYFGVLYNETGHSVTDDEKKKKLVEEFGEKLGTAYFELCFKE